VSPVYARAGLPFVDGRQECGRPDVDPELFFYAVDERGPAKRLRDEQAKAICAGCPLRPDCLAHALTHAEWGVWGGTNEDDRARLQRTHGLPLRGGARALAKNRSRARDRAAQTDTENHHEEDTP
jgi:WhiB family redox-sensing transcriptional regulator